MLSNVPEIYTKESSYGRLVCNKPWSFVGLEHPGLPLKNFNRIARIACIALIARIALIALIACIARIARKLGIFFFILQWLCAPLFYCLV